MAKKQFPSDKQDQFMIRLPDGMRERLKNAADKSKRSMNAEIVARLEESFDTPLRIPDHLLRRIAFSARSQGQSVQSEVLQMLSMMYPEIPTADELIQDVEDLISRAEELQVGYDGGLKARLSEYLGELRERITSIALVEAVDTRPDGRQAQSKTLPKGFIDNDDDGT